MALDIRLAATQVMQGLCALEPSLVLLDQAPINAERLRHLLWNSTLPIRGELGQA